MYDTSIDVYQILPVDLEFIVSLLASILSILLAVIVTAQLDCVLWHANGCSGKLQGELYVIIVKTCFACAHLEFYVHLKSNLLATTIISDFSSVSAVNMFLVIFV